MDSLEFLLDEGYTDVPKLDETASISAEKSAIPTSLTPEVQNLFKCSHCNYSSRIIQHYKSHVDSHERHTGTMYQCDICSVQFSQKANMHRHKLRHNGIKPFACIYCPKTFFRKDQMQEHLLCHIKGGHDFDCPIYGCRQLFAEHAELRKHLDTEHVISMHRSARCKKCTSKFTSPKRLILHYQTKHFDDEAAAEGILQKLAVLPSMQKSNSSDDLSGSGSDESRVELTSSPNTQSDASSFADADSETAWSNLADISSQAPIFQGSKQQFDARFDQNNALSRGLLEENQDFSDAAALSPELAGFSNGCDVAELISFLCSNVAPDLSNNQAPGTPDCQFFLSRMPSEQEGVQFSSTLSENQPSNFEFDNDTDNHCCVHCGIIFTDEILYKMHKELHSPQNPFTCNICGAPSLDKYAFTFHILICSH